MNKSKLLYRIGAGVALVASVVLLILSIDSAYGNVFMLIAMPLLFATIILGTMSLDTDVNKGKNKKKKRR